MNRDGKLWIGQGESPVYLLSEMANRHGLIAGATGTGKTTTLKVMAEAFSAIGVPVFLSDIKGDLASLAIPGSGGDKIDQRLALLGLDAVEYTSFPVQFWDIYGESGHPVRTTISEMGALLLSRILDLNETQTGVMSIIFRIADKSGLLLLDLKDLRSIIAHIGENRKKYTLRYGNVSSASIGAILRALLVLEDQGGEGFFGEPQLDFYDWMKTERDGRGVINILHSEKLYQNPILYSTFLLWMLSELFEMLPEVGDLPQPKMVFFFDEAHLLFDNAPNVLIQKIEQVVRLIRSKGVGVYFITQNPADLPDSILGQLGNRVQHALRAYTPREIKRIAAAAQTFRANPEFDTVDAITDLATGEALISCLDSDGRPTPVSRAWIMPPQSRFGTIDSTLREKMIEMSLMNGKYNRAIDRESAYEMLRARAEKEQAQVLKEDNHDEKKKKALPEKKTRGYTRQTPMEKATNAAMSTIGREVSRFFIRGILGSLKK